MKKKQELIVDSDVSNEIDDIFALAYILSRQDAFNVKLISISPFSANYKRNSIRDNSIDSLFEAKRLMRIIGMKNTEIVKYGSIDYVSNGYFESSPAVEEIIRIAQKSKITILCIGTLTNLAIAITKEPKIAKNIRLVFLGTQNLFYEKFTDANYSNDKKAFEIVVNSIRDITIIPNYVAKQFVTSIYETKNHLCTNKLGRYLHKIISNSVFKIQNRGIHTIYDIAPVAYLLNKKHFCETKIDVNMILKEQNKILPSHTINYVFDLNKQANYKIWKDFIKSVTSIQHKTSPKIYFTSDTHFSSQRVIDLKSVPFSTVDEMNYELVKRWNSVVTKSDYVYHLGDFGEYNFIKKLNGKVILILGNYEINDMKKQKLTFAQFREKLLKLGFNDVIENKYCLKIDEPETEIYLTHKPTNCTKGHYNLFGHVHKLKPINKYGFNVGTTYFDFAPISLDQVKSNIYFIKIADKDVFA